MVDLSIVTWCYGGRALQKTRLPCKRRLLNNCFERCAKPSAAVVVLWDFRSPQSHGVDCIDPDHHFLVGGFNPSEKY